MCKTIIYNVISVAYGWVHAPIRATNWPDLKVTAEVRSRKKKKSEAYEQTIIIFMPQDVSDT